MLRNGRQFVQGEYASIGKAIVPMCTKPGSSAEKPGLSNEKLGLSNEKFSAKNLDFHSIGPNPGFSSMN